MTHHCHHNDTWKLITGNWIWGNLREDMNAICSPPWGISHPSLSTPVVQTYNGTNQRFCSGFPGHHQRTTRAHQTFWWHLPVVVPVSQLCFAHFSHQWSNSHKQGCWGPNEIKCRNMFLPWEPKDAGNCYPGSISNRQWLTLRWPERRSLAQQTPWMMAM